MKYPTPRAELLAFEGYGPRTREASVDLYLDANEGRATPAINVAPERLAEVSRAYPSAELLRVTLAERLGRRKEDVVVTAGADDAIDRICRSYLSDERALVVATPTFGMIPRYGQLAGAEVIELPWTDDWPLEDALAIDADTVGVIAVVTPNNPTGAVVSRDTVEVLSEAFPRSVVMVDAAYGEFASDDWTLATDLPGNVVVVRTLSKAWGLAGLRVGYALAPSPVAKILAAVGSPYPVAGPSAEVAAQRLRVGDAFLEPAVTRTRSEREELTELLDELGARPVPSEANFVLARFEDADWVARALRTFGISVRRFEGELNDALRITCPCDELSFKRLTVALRAALRPDAILFDMDGVLADVSRSYREAIIQTAASYGVELTLDEIAEAKRAGEANDDWELTRQMLEARGVSSSLTEVTRRFESLYQEGPQALWRNEQQLIGRESLSDLRQRVSTGIITGRPRGDATRFLDNADMNELFAVVVTREDAPLKPQPDGIRLALASLSAEAAWYIGDTPDDIWAARRAGVLPVGVVGPGEDPETTRAALERAGAAVVFDNAMEVEQWLS